MRRVGLPATELAPTSRCNALSSTSGSADGCLVDILYTQHAKALQKRPCVRSNECTRVSVISRTSRSTTNASTNGRPKPTLLPVLRCTDQTQHWPKPGSWSLVYTHRSSNDHRSHVITQRPPGSKGPLPLYVHTQETADHTLLRVAVCNKTVVSRLSVHVRLLNQKRNSNYK